MLHWLKPFAQRIFVPLAKLLLRLGVTPDAVTLFGTFMVMAISLILIPRGHLIAAALLLAWFAAFDWVDGLLARMSGTSGPWGAMLDATMDRFADGALLGALIWYFLRLPLAGTTSVGTQQLSGPVITLTERNWGIAATIVAMILTFIVPYTRARAEAGGAKVGMGVMERGTRVALTLIAVFVTGLGILPTWFLPAMLSVIALGSFITVIQRLLDARRQLGGLRFEETEAIQEQQGMRLERAIDHA